MLKMLMNDAERAAYEDAKRDHFVIVRARVRPDLRYAYKNYCRENQIPFIEVRPHRVYSVVRLDMITSPFDLNDDGVRLVFGRLRNLNCDKNNVEFGRMTCSCRRVPRDLAPMLAREIWQLVNTPENRAQVGMLAPLTRGELVQIWRS